MVQDKMPGKRNSESVLFPEFKQISACDMLPDGATPVLDCEDALSKDFTYFSINWLGMLLGFFGFSTPQVTGYCSSLLYTASLI